MLSKTLLILSLNFSSQAFMKCPICGNEGCAMLVDSIDIGVGNQEHATGAECPRCGNIEYCDRCGGWDGKHASWCELFENL